MVTFAIKLVADEFIICAYASPSSACPYTTGEKFTTTCARAPPAANSNTKHNKDSNIFL
jgi:hypothetical protein